MIKGIITGLLIAFSFVAVHSQQTICLGDDTEACVGSPITIEVCGSISYNTYNLTNPTAYPLGDDDFTGIINLGFDFVFYGTTYNQIVASDNGVLSFNSANANGYCPWSVENIPTNTAEIQNSILCPWQDLYNPAGGDIYYETIGTAPNRIGVLFYDGLSMYAQSCQTPDQCFSGGVLLFEGSNRIETHFANKTSCSSWGGGVATHGLNYDGAIAHPVPGRNNSVWTAQNDGWEFVPTSATDYDVNQIPYAIINYDTNSGVVWEDTDGNSYPFNNGVLNTTVQSGTVGYFLSSSTCGVGVGSISDTSFITGISVSATTTVVDDECSQGIGEATVSASGGNTPYTYSWDDPSNQTTQTATNLFGGTYTVTVTDAIGCQATATVTIGDTPISLNTTYTQVSCPGGNDGTATVEIIPTPGSATYDWYDAGNQTTQTATGLSAGTYNVAVETDVGCQDTATVVVDEIPGLLVSLVSSEDVTCNSGNDGQAVIDVTQGTPAYTYNWNTSGETTANPTSLVAGINTVTVTDANSCVVNFDVDLDEPAPLQLTSVSQDTIACVGDSVQLYANGSGGSTAYTYTWRNNGNVVGTGEIIYVTPSSDNAEYCVTLSEQCGSPEVQECLTISHPEEIVPLISPDNTGACVPVQVNFDNVTTSGEAIDYTVWNYGDGQSDTIQGTNTANHNYEVGLFDVTVEIVSERGCSYFSTFNSLIEGYAHPKAAFFVNPNPASVFEPKVNVYNQSSNDVISFQWFADDAEPNFSTIENPSFVFPEEVDNYPVTLVVENGNGCRDTVQHLVIIQNEVLIFAPNSFTPDSDGRNDKWRVYMQGIDVSQFHLEVFNRWGETVFESYDPEGVWDGTYGAMGIVKDGTYVWKITARDAENDNKYEFKGFVNVLK